MIFHIDNTYLDYDGGARIWRTKLYGWYDGKGTTSNCLLSIASCLPIGENKQNILVILYMMSKNPDYMLHELVGKEMCEVLYCYYTDY